MLKCRKCGTPLAKPATGRPPRYCSTGCRRAAEYEIRRLNRHLERLESDRETLANYRTRYRDLLGRTHRQQVADTVQAIAGAEARLKKLLDDDGRVD